MTEILDHNCSMVLLSFTENKRCMVCVYFLHRLTYYMILRFLEYLFIYNQSLENSHDTVYRVFFKYAKFRVFCTKSLILFLMPDKINYKILSPPHLTSQCCHWFPIVKKNMPHNPPNNDAPIPTSTSPPTTILL